MKKTLFLLLLLPGCATPNPVLKWGARCEAEMEVNARLGWVRRMIDARDKIAIPVLIDCLEEAKRQAKKPDRDPQSKVIKPLTHGPELWALYVLTGQDFDRDIRKWRDWWIMNRGKLVWDSTERGFRIKQQ